MKLNTTLLLAALALAATGCSTPAYRCPLKGEPEPGTTCRSAEDAYKASLRAKKTAGQTYSVFDSKAPAEKQAEQPFFHGQTTNYPAPPGAGAPVFNQPRVFQPWLAPYVDAEGNLRSGEYGYFSTPGRWNYGSLKKAGQASAIFEPARPSDLGFTPAVKPKAASAAPPRPADAPAAAAPAAQPTATATRSAPTNNITQPYKRLTDDE